MNGIDVPGHCRIPESELKWEFTTSGGPGGQHANRSETRVTLRWDYEHSPSLSLSQKTVLRRMGGSRTAGGVITITSDRTRSQSRNRHDARERLAELIADLLRPKKKRRATKPTTASRRRRLHEKRRRGETKQLRKRPDY